MPGQVPKKYAAGLKIRCPGGACSILGPLIPSTQSLASTMPHPWRARFEGCGRKKPRLFGRGSAEAASVHPAGNFGHRAHHAFEQTLALSAPSGSKCPVTFMTASDDEATRKDGIDAECIAYLRKPFPVHALV